MAPQCVSRRRRRPERATLRPPRASCTWWTRPGPLGLQFAPRGTAIAKRGTHPVHRPSGHEETEWHPRRGTRSHHPSSRTSPSGHHRGARPATGHYLMQTTPRVDEADGICRPRLSRISRKSTAQLPDIFYATPHLPGGGADLADDGELVLVVARRLFDSRQPCRGLPARWRVVRISCTKSSMSTDWLPASPRSACPPGRPPIPNSSRTGRRVG